MPISIDNLINVNFIKGDIDLLRFGLMLGGKGQHKPYILKPEDLFFLGEKARIIPPATYLRCFRTRQAQRLSRLTAILSGWQ